MFFAELFVELCDLFRLVLLVLIDFNFLWSAVFRGRTKRIEKNREACIEGVFLKAFYFLRTNFYNIRIFWLGILIEIRKKTLQYLNIQN